MEPERQNPAQPVTSQGVPTYDPQTNKVSNQPVNMAPTPQLPLQPLEAPFGSGDMQPTQPNQPPAYVPLKPKRHWLAGTLVMLFLLAGVAAGYVFAVYLPNRPDAIYSASLQNTAKAVDGLAAYVGSASRAKAASYTVSGKLSVKDNSTALADISGAFDADANGKLTVKAQLLGQNVSAEVRSLRAQNSKAPDVYVRLSGIKRALDTYGISYFDSLDGQWLAVDHTLLQGYLKTASKQTDNTNAFILPTQPQLADAALAVQKVTKAYLFTADSDKAVPRHPRYIGKETKDGRTTYHYKVGYSKTQLQAYLQAVKVALNGSKLNSWAKAAYDGKTISQVLDITALQKDLAKAKTGYSFDMWADADTKLVHALQFTDPSDTSMAYVLTQNYTGGSTYPILLSTTKKTTKSKTQTSSLQLILDSKTNKVAITMQEQGAQNGLLNLTITPSNNKLQIDAPKDSQSVQSILDLLGITANSSTDVSAAT